MMKNTVNPLVSVIIPVKNGAATIRECLDGIFSQTIAGKLEVIVIDSGSQDGTDEILQEYRVIVQKIPSNSFNHGATRNLGVSLASGEFVVFTVQDAVPAGPEWLETLLKHFGDPTVAGVCGQQIVDHHPSKNPLQWFRPAGLPEVRKISIADFHGLPVKEKHQLCRWDNVSAAYRKSVLMEIPFRHVTFGEDALWAKDALTLGRTIVYDYNARVLHYHHQTFSFYFKRSYVIFYQEYRYFRYLKPEQFYLLAVARSFYHMYRMELPLKQRMSWMIYNLNLINARLLAKLIFRALVLIGSENVIDRGLQVFCRQIPQGRQNNLKTQFT